MNSPGDEDLRAETVTLRATQPHVTRRLAALLGEPEPVLSGPTWVDELYETLAAMTPSERNAVRASTEGERGDLSADTVLQRGRTPWLPAMLDEGDLFMAYQPIVDLSSGETVAYEALVRGALGDDVVAGHQIVAAAHAHDRVRQLDESARTLALEQAAGALDGGERLFVNFDPMSVYDPEICLRNTWATARRVGIGIEQVCFEIVDAERCPDLDFLRRIIERFRAEGASVALQNLGAERTGVTYLRELQPDIVKIDRRLTTGLQAEESRTRMVGGMIDYAHELGCTVGVVGIETEDDLRCVRELGADLGQGFYLAPPVRRIGPADAALITASPLPATAESREDGADALTGLPHRPAFQEHVEHLLEAGRSLSVLMVDLRAFERITDLLGHDVGDQVLVTVAESLRHEVGKAGMVARLGGDQFLVALNDVRSNDEAARFARHLVEAVDAAALESELPAPHPDVGVATGPTDGQDAGSLLRHAGQALHRAREQPLARP
ncbi:MAG TPA: GGDEF domain-containing protein [Thermoleophilaceae bacterium]|nr:GGDEF domain-containing protein [Thermoleophilaceae bacterium]